MKGCECVGPPSTHPLVRVLPAVTPALYSPESPTSVTVLLANLITYLHQELTSSTS